MIEVKNLVKRYGNHLAVDHISFTLESGRIYGFLGPNGAGKSTTMNIMTGYIGATEGTVIINGHDILKEPKEAKRCIGYLPELPPLYMDMRVEEYLQFAAELKEIPAKKRSKAVIEAAQMTGLTDVMPRLIKNLSKGYRQRVGFAQAILGMPEIIILDEPTVGLDPIQIIEIRTLMKNLSKDHTVILSSHILSEISAVCDHILIISHGKLVASDTAQNLMQHMDSSHKVDLTVKGEGDAVAGALRQIKGVTDLEEKEEDGFAVCTVYTDGTEIREKVFTLCTEHNWPIYEMKYSKASLEDVFMELTADGESGKDSPKPEESETDSRQAEESEKDTSGIEGEETDHESDL